MKRPFIGLTATGLATILATMSAHADVELAFDRAGNLFGRRRYLTECDAHGRTWFRSIRQSQDSEIDDEIQDRDSVEPDETGNWKIVKTYRPSLHLEE
jgi:hypothetical protein